MEGSVQPRKPRPALESRMSRSAPGLTKAISMLSGRLVDIDATTSQVTSLSQKNTLPNPKSLQTLKANTKKKRRLSPCSKEQELFTAGSPLINKKTISNGKSKRFKTSSQSTKFSKTFAPVSTTSARACPGFWSKSKQEQSKKLWWPTKIDWHVSGSNSSNGSSLKQEHLSSFSTLRFLHPTKNSLKTSWRSSTYSLAGSTEKEDTTKLSKKEKTERGKAYQGKSNDEKKNLKVCCCLLFDLDYTGKQ